MATIAFDNLEPYQLVSGGQVPLDMDIRGATAHYLGRTQSIEDLDEIAFSGDWRGSDPERIKDVLRYLIDRTQLRLDVAREDVLAGRNRDPSFSVERNNQELRELLGRLEHAGTPEGENRKSRVRRHAEYIQAQPWHRRPIQDERRNLIVPLNSAYRAAKLSGVPNDQLADARARISEIKRALDPGDYTYPAPTYPILTQTVDLYGDICDAILEQHPVPEGSCQSGAMEHVMESTRAGLPSHAPPRKGEEGVIAISPDRQIYIFDDGSVATTTGRQTRYYQPGSDESQKLIKKSIRQMKQRDEDTSELEKYVSVRRGGRRPVIGVWDERLSLLDGPQDNSPTPAALGSIVSEYQDYDGSRRPPNEYEYRGIPPTRQYQR